MIRRPPRSTLDRSSAASDVYKRQGEKVSGSVNEWAQVLDYVAQLNMDLMRWVNGEITDQQVASGEYMRDWVSASKLGAAPNLPKTLSKDEINLRTQAIDHTIMKMNGLTPADAKLPRQVRLEKASQNLSMALGPSITPKLEANKA